MKRKRLQSERGAILVLVLFLMAMTTPLVCLMLESHASHIRCAHNNVEGMMALYVAQAGIHDAVNELLQDADWRDGFTDKVFPAGAGNTYTVTVEDGESGIDVTSTGTAASGFTKTVTMTVTGLQ